MAKVTLDLPDELLAEATEAGLDISRLAAEAVASALRVAKTNAWLAEMRDKPRSGVRSEDVQEALRHVRDNWGA